MSKQKKEKKGLLNDIMSKSSLTKSKEKKMRDSKEEKNKLNDLLKGLTPEKIKKISNKHMRDVHSLTPAQVERLVRGKKVPRKKSLKFEEPKKEFKFGIVTDTHLCSTLCKLDELKEFYKIMEKEGVTEVLHAGDMVAGNGKMFRGQLSEMTCYGFDQQAEEVINEFPSIPGVTTHAIAGNHDLSFFNDNGADLMQTVADSRDDINYLGHYEAMINLHGVKIKLLHPERGSGYAITYKSQRMVEQMEEKNKPDIFILGHWHTSCYFNQCDVHVIHGGCWEGQGAYLVRKGIWPSIGGWIVTVKTNGKGKLLSVQPEFYTFNA